MFRILSMACLIAFVARSDVASATDVFFTNFDTGAPPEIDRPTETTGTQGFAGLGAGDNVFGGDFLRDEEVGGVVTLTLEALPPHATLDLHFLLAIIDSWDGGGPSPGSDYLTVSVDGTPVFSEAFENSGYSPATYSPPPGVLLYSGGNLGFRGGVYFNDSAYDMSREPAFIGIPHTSDIVTIQWFTSGAGYQGGADESWALDNIRVTVEGTVPVESRTWAQIKETFADELR